MKGIISRLFTAARGAATEVGEEIADSQSMRILDQEIRDAERDLEKAKSHLAQLMGEQVGVERGINTIKANIKDYEGSAIGAMDKGDEGLATRIADRIADLEEDLRVKEAALEQFRAAVKTTRRAISSSEVTLGGLRRQVSVVKATETAQKVSVSAAARYSGTESSMGSATESLRRLQERQRKREDRMRAAEQIAGEEDGSNLDRDIAQAGLKVSGNSGSAVLARLREQKARETESAE